MSIGCSILVHALLTIIDRQLKPTNTSAKEKIQFNAYSNRLDIALPCRLVREGFPCYRLREQRRMHTTIASFPNNKFYDGELRNGPGTSKVLDAVKPGLQCQLEMILGGQPYSNRRRQYFMGGAHENDVRLVWLEVNGRREMAPSRSMIVQAHVDVFFNWVFPKLHGYFKQSTENMEDNVMIICAYSATVSQLHVLSGMACADNRRCTHTATVSPPCWRETTPSPQPTCQESSQLTPVRARSRSWSSSTAHIRTGTSSVSDLSSAWSLQFTDTCQAS